MSDTTETPVTPATGARPARTRLAIAAAGLLVLGAGAGAVVVQATRPAVTMAPLAPVAIRSLDSSRQVVTIRGRVAEVYGNKFILGDASGRALVDTGPEGDDAALVAVGAPVTVQGRFERGFMRAAFVVGADGKVTALGPMHGPGRDGPRGHGPHRRGPGGPEGRGPDDRGPDGRGDDAGPPPPPPPVAAAATPKAQAAPAQ